MESPLPVEPPPPEVHERVRVDARTHPTLAAAADDSVFEIFGETLKDGNLQFVRDSIRAGGIYWTCRCGRFHLTAAESGIKRHLNYEAAVVQQDGWIPIDGGHGGRLGWRGRYHYQIAAPWKPEGCSHQADRSFDWNATLVYRRDKGRCQSCGAKVRPRMKTAAWGPKTTWSKDDPDVREGEVQHIIPKIELAKRNGMREALQDERRMRREYLGLRAGHRRGKAADPQWYKDLGNCPHNLALLCRECHEKTFRGLPGQAKFAGIPAPPRGRQELITRRPSLSPGSYCTERDDAP